MNKLIEEISKHIKDSINKDMPKETIEILNSIDKKVLELDKEVSKAEEEKLEYKEKYIKLLKDYPVGDHEQTQSNQPKTDAEILAEIENKYGKKE